MVSNKILWSGDELGSVFGLKGFDAEIRGISIDSRTTVAGDLFIALSGDPGPRFGGGGSNAGDGHDFIERAVNAGAAAVMVHRKVQTPVPQINVGDTLDGLWQLGSASRQRTRGKVVAITGSSGKTTIRSWLQGVLNAMVNCHASEGSLNNHWGVPLSLARMPAGTEAGLFEIGTNHPGEIAPLSKLTEPDVALVLNVLPAHIGNFTGMDELKQEKLSISEGLRSDGMLILPAKLASASGYRNILTFGQGGDIQAQGTPTDTGMQVRVNVAGQSIECHVPFAGAERVETLAAMFAVFSAMNVNPEEAARHMESLELPKGRGNPLDLGGITFIDDSYNANPASMKMSLSDLGQRKGCRRRIALLGEMLELGSASSQAHQQIGQHLDGIDEVYTFGPGFNNVTFRRDGHFDAIDEFDLNAFAGRLEPGDCVLVKGSNKVFWKHGFVSRLTEQAGQ